ncbi:MAG TPA: NTP transferase domain-containing protein [Vicinamibacteria bacterium]|nr:NTP transferase domain-containing protein [Vicinamibacteria bacterium]
MGLSLVVLAAGVGSRYGGPKQIDRVGPGGATLLDYAAFDARRAGFERVILVVREGMESDVRGAVGDRIGSGIPVAYAVQGDALPSGFLPPAGRRKPWGTGHATLAAAPLVDGPFAVINADDFYGANSYRVLAGHLRRPQGGAVPEFAIVGFPLASTLSPDGPVSRGVCTVDAGGFLVSIREVLKVERDGEDARELDGAGGGRPIPGPTPVSLNFWGFTPALLPALEEGFRRFLDENAGSAREEYFLLSAVQSLVDRGRARVRVLGGGGPWGGLTYPGDRPRLVALLESLTARGEYPRDLWA